MKKARENLKSFAGVGVAHRRREEAKAEGEHDKVQHEMLLCVVMRRPDERPSRFGGGATRRIGFRDGSNGNVIGIS